jgi:hypothetical protein
MIAASHREPARSSDSAFADPAMNPAVARSLTSQRVDVLM